MKKSAKQIPELKFNNSQPKIKRRIFECFAEADLDIAYALLRKERVPSHLHHQHQKIYNYLVASLASKIVAHYQPVDSVDIVIDRSLNGIQREDFDDYLLFRMINDSQRNPLSEKQSEERWLQEGQIEIYHLDSASDLCIQAVDFIAGAIHEHYRNDGGIYYPEIKHQIIMSYDYFSESSKSK